MFLKVHKIVQKTKVEGPGTRFCIWVQGCKRNCKGCFMPLAQPQGGGELIDVDALFKQIQKCKETIEGVTFLGGEPFEQAQALSYIAKKVQGMSLSVLTFTGYKYETLLGLNDKHVNELLANTDLLIDGEFQEQNLDYSRPWVGSSNQRYLFLTKKYTWGDIKDIKNQFELSFSYNGKIKINGMGNLNKLKQIVLGQIL